MKVVTAGTSATAEAATKDSGQTLRLVLRMLRFLKPVRTTAIIACLFLVLRILVELATVYFLSPAITTVGQSVGTSRPSGFLDWILGADESARGLREVLLWMLSAQVALGALVFLRSIWDAKFGMRVICHIRGEIYDHLQHLAFTFYDRMTAGKVINRALNDVSAVHAFVNTSVLSTLDIVISLTAYIALLSYRSPWLLLTALIPVPFWFFIMRAFSRKAQPLYRGQQEAADELMTALTENIGGKHVVKAFGTEQREVARYEALNDSLYKRLVSVITLHATLDPALRGVAIAAHISVFGVCAWLIQRKQLPIGDLMILGAAMGTILSKLSQINSIVQIYQRAAVSARRLFEILDTAPMRPKLDGISGLQITEGTIEFEGVGFGYAPGQEVLRDLSCRLPGGKVTTLIGGTGSGKSTLSALIARFYDPVSGSIKIDGQDIKDVSLFDLRHQVGFVFQETFLFSDTIRNNILYGRTDVSPEMLEKAARIAHADEFIVDLPKGYDTLIGERGVQLSGGQRQRLALARALVYDPAILILDDATAALDATTEARIRERLADAFRGRTVLFITHRLANLALGDQVMVLEDGEIMLTGKHNELLQRSADYRALILEQARPKGPAVFADAVAAPRSLEGIA